MAYLVAAPKFFTMTYSSGFFCLKSNVMKKENTERGFNILKGVDRYNCGYSLQESSIATEPCVWLGIDDANPIILAADAKKLGIETNKNIGWMDYHIPKEVLLTTRMHLTIDMAKDLIKHLEYFVETGEL